MSLRGRYIIDRCKRFLTKASFSLPCPPYSSAEYWESAYAQLGPNDVYEWGGVEFDDLWPQYTYRPVQLSHHAEAHNLKDYRSLIANFGRGGGSSSRSSARDLRGNIGSARTDDDVGETDPPSSSSSSSAAAALFVSDLGSVMNIVLREHQDNSTPGKIDAEVLTKQRQQAILMLGCGNSRLGEDMIMKGRWDVGPIIQVDVSHRVIETMSLRCSEMIQNGHMNFIQDDATELTAFRDNMIDACFDKGLIDAIYCAEEYETIHNIMHQVHRVLKPGSAFCFMSFSRPDFLLPTLFDASTINFRHRGGARRNGRHRKPSATVPWKSLEVQQLSSILLYRFIKSDNIGVDDDDEEDYLHKSQTSTVQNVTRVRPVRLRRRDGK